MSSGVRKMGEPAPELFIERLRQSGGRILGLDVGDRFVGVAVSDAGVRVANPVGVVARKKERAAYTRADIPMHGGGTRRPLVARPEAEVYGEIRSFATQFDAWAVVVGLPNLPDGTVSKQSLRNYNFVQKLQNEGGLSYVFRRKKSPSQSTR